MNRWGVTSRDSSGFNSNALQIECGVWTLEVIDALPDGWKFIIRMNCSNGSFACENMEEYNWNVEMIHGRRDFSWF